MIVKKENDRLLYIKTAEGEFSILNTKDGLCITAYNGALTIYPKASNQIVIKEVL